MLILGGPVAVCCARDGAAENVATINGAMLSRPLGMAGFRGRIVIAAFKAIDATIHVMPI